MGLTKRPVPSKKTPAFLSRYQQKIKLTFKRPENANILMSFITGNKNGISPYTKKAFKRVNLGFLLSPSGIHLSGILFFMTFFFKRINHKWLRRLVKSGVFFSMFFIPNLDSLKRSGLFRLLFQYKFLSKKISTEMIFILGFLLSFLAGQFTSSPLGFIFSFAFLGTFFSLGHHSKAMLILGLFSTHLILGLFMGEKVSLLSIPCGLIGSFIFTFLFPLFLLFLMSFWLIEINWVEPLLRGYVVCIQSTSKLLTGSFTSSSIFLILAVWAIMFLKNSKRKYGILFILLFLHTNTAMTPTVFATIGLT